MKDENKVAAIQKSIEEHMKASLSALRGSIRKGVLKDNFRTYVAIFKDGKEVYLDADEMTALVNTDRCEDLALSLHVWVYAGDSGNFACCEIATALGIQASWASDLDLDEDLGWQDPELMGCGMPEYFRDRNHFMSESVREARFKATIENEELGINPARWVANSKASDHGAN